jgi:hypothetical protein
MTVLSTGLLWLLVSVGQYGRAETRVIERFGDRDECQRVLLVIRGATSPAPTLVCVQARIYPPW